MNTVYDRDTGTVRRIRMPVYGVGSEILGEEKIPREFDTVALLGVDVPNMLTVSVVAPDEVEARSKMANCSQSFQFYFNQILELVVSD